MTMSELATIVENNLPVKFAIFNNGYLGMVHQWQDIFYGKDYYATSYTGNPDFVKLAEAYGIKSFRIRRAGDVTRILKKALDYKAGPVLIDAVVVKADNVFPMIPSGAPVADMLINEPLPTTKLEKPVGST